MRAVVAHSAGDFRLEEVPEPAIGEGALLRVEAAGICAADRMIFAGDSPWLLHFPFVPGHEVVGVVESIDPLTAERWKVQVGDRVVPEVMVPCAACGLCRAGRSHLCRNGVHIGSGVPGGWAERLWLPRDAIVWRVPGGVDPEEAVLVEPLACAIHAVRRADPRPDEVFVVSGIGAIGACALVYAAVARSPSRLVALVTSPERAALARDLGATDTIDVRTQDAEQELARLSEGRGVDGYLEVSGRTEAVDLGLRALSPGGRLTLYGVYGRPGSVDWNVVAELKELEIRGAHLAPGTFGEAIELIASRRVDARRLVTGRFALDRVSEALAEERGGHHTTLKTILVPGLAPGSHPPPPRRQPAMEEAHA